MADQATPPSGSGLTIPADTELKFGTILALIKGSESMNNEERQYWINILPIMTEEQLKNLEEILTSEKKQLAAIDEKYAKQSPPSGDPSLAGIADKIRERKKKREELERKHSEEEEKKESALLEQIQSL